MNCIPIFYNLVDTGMDTDQFESLLRERATKPTLTIYKDSTNNIKSAVIPSCYYSANDIITSVKSSLEAIQNADCVKSSKNRNKLASYKKNLLLSVNSLDFEKEESKTTVTSNKFETQCVSDTQLIDIIDKAEAAIQINTEEFNTSFCGDLKLENKSHKTDSIELSAGDGVSNKKRLYPDILEIEEQNITLKHHIDSNDDVTITENYDRKVNQTKFFNKSIDVDVDLDDLGVVIDEIKQPNSPILNMGVKTPSQHLIYNLDDFENFEKTAHTLLKAQKYEYFDTGEVYLHPQGSSLEDNIENKKDDRIDDPTCNLILKIPLKNTDNVKRIEVVKQKETTFTKEEINPEDNRTVTPKLEDSFLNDEILFSSDEESDYINYNSQDLPMTCALETSFYSINSGHLNKTMYVGFQTASDKSIQISIDSFGKAQEVLNELDEEHDKSSISSKSESKGIQMADHETDKADSANEQITYYSKNTPEVKFNRSEVDTVEMKPVFKDNFEQIDNNTFNDFHTASNKHFNQDAIVEHETNFTKGISCLGGFKTASNKKIDISDKSLEISKKIFENLDNTGNSCLIDDNENNNKVQNASLCGFKNAKDLVLKGFSTASNKKIFVSEKALATSKAVFQNIDINEQVPFENEDDLLLEEFSTELNDISESKDIFKSITKNNSTLNPIHSKNTEITSKICSEENCENIGKVIVSNSKNIDDEVAVTFTDGETMFPGIVTESGTKIQNKFEGFKTAGNRKVNISIDALAKTKKIFRDIEVERNINEFNINTNKYKTFVGFQTASNKEVKISREALNKSKKMFQEIPEDTKELLTDCNIIGDDCSAAVEKQTNKIIGFQTASNKRIIISKEALVKTKNFFEDTTLNDENIDKYDSAALKIKLDAICIEMSDGRNASDAFETNKNTNFIGFKTASNKHVNISDVALQKTKQILHDFDMNNLPESNKTENFVGFQTASNKKVVICEEALAKTKKIFEDIEFSQPNVVQDKIVGRNAGDAFEANKNTNFIGFQTASNKHVNISNVALQKTKQILHDFDMNNLPESNKTENFVGFQTASNKKVVICEEALAKTKKIFEDIEFSQPNVVQDIGKDRLTNLVGFKKPSNKNVNISDKALAKTKNIFQDLVNNQQMKIDGQTEPNQIQNSLAFHTGNNKEVDITEAAKAKSKKIFNDIDDKNNPLHINRTNFDFVEKQTSGFMVFNTASNKKVNVSENALIETKNIFDNVECHYLQQTSTDGVLLKQDGKPSKETNNENIKTYINTQVLNNFDETMNTEDFLKSPKAAKRASSPILSCPKAKKRKVFQTPYKLKLDIDTPKNVPEVPKKLETSIEFKENYKKTKILKLEDIRLLEERTESNVQIDKYITNFKFENLLDFEFRNGRNDISNETLTIADLKRQFLESVDRKIVPDNWMDNHIKLIIWKLICYEIRFTNTMSNICSAKNVMDQLKWRYDKELYKVERPALRKILEKDDLPSRTMILFVVSILEDGENVRSVTNMIRNIELILSDGWYCVRASIDGMLSKLVFGGKIKVGSKIVTCGAELMNCEQGVSPWEDTTKVRLKLYGNSTRPARWDARLGYHGNAAILLPLSTVRVDGGKVAKTRVFVTRVYPLLYVEKFEDGSTVTRSERLEQIHQMKYESQRQVLIEKIYEDIEKELSDQSSQESETTLGSGYKRGSMDTGSQIAKLMKRSRDPSEFRSHLTDSQSRHLEEHMNKQRDKRLQNIQERMQERISNTVLANTRNVVAVMKLRVSGIQEKNGVLHVTKGMMSIWKPNDAILDIVKEGAWIDVQHVVPTAFRCTEIQLSAGRQSIFKAAKVKMTPKTEAYTKNIARTSFTIKSLTQNSHANTDYNEIDTAGLIFFIDPPNIEFENTSNKTHFQNVFFTDQDKNLICVNFWGGIKKFGFENIIVEAQIVACVNVQKRLGNTRKNIPQFRVTEFTYFTNTPKNAHSRLITEDLVKKFNGIDRRKFCQDCIEKKNNFNAINSKNNYENISPYRFNNTDYNLSKNKIFIDTPVAERHIKKPTDDLNLTGLDFDSTFKQRDTQDMSPELLNRKRLVKEKIARLKMYGEPPPLSPINIINRSTSAYNSYRSPVVINKMSTSNVQDESPKTTRAKNSTINKKENNVASITANESVIRIRDELKTSPVLSSNRNYSKRPSVLPVKLNFYNNFNVNEQSIDHFAEDFESSPPLSLD